MASIVSSAASKREPGGRLTRIVVTGSESTGKTLLAQQLAEHFGVPWVAEFARDYAERKPGELSAADVDAIGRGQVRREDAAGESARGLIILDTDLVSTLVYSDQYYGFIPEWIPDTAKARLADLYLVCDIDVPWVADTVRDAQHARPAMHRAFLRHLEELGATYRLVRGSGPERFAQALAHIADWRSGVTV